MNRGGSKVATVLVRGHVDVLVHVDVIRAARQCTEPEYQVEEGKGDRAQVDHLEVFAGLFLVERQEPSPRPAVKRLHAVGVKEDRFVQNLYRLEALVALDGVSDVTDRPLVVAH